MESSSTEPFSVEVEVKESFSKLGTVTSHGPHTIAVASKCGNDLHRILENGIWKV